MCVLDGFLEGLLESQGALGGSQGRSKGSLEGPRGDPRSPKGPMPGIGTPTFGPWVLWWGVRGVNPPSH